MKNNLITVKTLKQVVQIGFQFTHHKLTLTPIISTDLNTTILHEIKQHYKFTTD